MAFMKDLSSSLRRRPHEVPVAEVQKTESDKYTGEKGAGHDVHDASDSEELSYDAQPGIQKMEATTKTWTMPWLITAYLLYVISSSSQHNMHVCDAMQECIWC
jgi:hypothetical protein